MVKKGRITIDYRMTENDSKRCYIVSCWLLCYNRIIKKGSVIMATMSITRNITISKEDLEKIQSSEPTPLLKEVYTAVEAKRSKVKLPENWIEKYVKK